MTKLSYKNQGIYLKKALETILGPPVTGTMAFSLCLHREIVEEFCLSDSLAIEGWEVRGVSNSFGNHPSFVAPDQAVDLRERKEGSFFLLIDQSEASTGLDGVYSASREISEKTWFDKASGQALSSMDERVKKFAQTAVKRAKELSQTNLLSPWRQLTFYANCAENPEKAGFHVSELGLWPISGQISDFTSSSLELSAIMVNRLLTKTDANLTARERVEVLLVKDQDVVDQLEAFLRFQAGKPWQETVRAAAQSSPQLWINAFEVGLMDLKVQRIEVIPWQKNPGSKPYKWSGLATDDDNLLEFQIDKNDPSHSLEVRWKAYPSELAAGSHDYVASILTDSDETLASVRVTHKATATQKARFRFDDFEHLDQDGKWEVRLQISVSDADREVESQTDEFLLTFGESEARVTTGTGNTVRSLVDDTIRLDSLAEFLDAKDAPTKEDSKGYVSLRIHGKSGRVYRPDILRSIETRWAENDFLPGRWMVKIRPDGTCAAAPRFEELDSSLLPSENWEKLNTTSRALGRKVLDRNGFVGYIHVNSDVSTNYVNAWSQALEQTCLDRLALANTLEVQSLAGKVIGLVVLPSHPSRVAWHQAYDTLALHARYEEGLTAVQTRKALETLDGAYMPAFLPSLTPGGSKFVFGDTLGFFHSAMIEEDASEPEAAIAQMARLLSSGGNAVVAATGASTAGAIAGEMRRYIKLHDAYDRLHIGAVNPGDGSTLALAIENFIALESQDEARTAIRLFLYPGENTRGTDVTGRDLADRAEQKRAGVRTAGYSSWMRESLNVDGIEVPRFQWAKRRTSTPDTAMHLTVGFDIFGSRLSAASQEELSTLKGELEAFGLATSLARRFSMSSAPEWSLWVPPTLAGEKHPAGRAFTDRLLRIHAASLKTVFAGPDEWPQLTTRLNADEVSRLKTLHKLSDWVVTVDRNAGLEYFDSMGGPEPEPFDAYVIDCVPERQDLRSIRLVTSTDKIDEVIHLLDDTLESMALSRSRKNSKFLLSQLKTVSGRLAMRLAGHGNVHREMIGLAMLYHNCHQNPGDNWLSTSEGFFVPIDDIADLFQVVERDVDGDALKREKADLIHVGLGPSNSLVFTFVEVKFRRLLSTAKSKDLLGHIESQTRASKKRWSATYFDPKLTKTQRVLKRRGLIRALVFYLEKAKRYGLNPEAFDTLYGRLMGLHDPDYKLSRKGLAERGYVFCPAYLGDPIVLNAATSLSPITLFGPEGMPEIPYTGKSSVRSVSAPPEPEPVKSAEQVGVVPPPVADGDSSAPDRGMPQAVAGDLDGSTIRLELGRAVDFSDNVSWSLGVDRNPHLMVVGLPGMGKTTTLINACCQLCLESVQPIVFAYHEDIEMRLRKEVGDVQVCSPSGGLGFNPLQVSSGGRQAWLDRVGMLRDIFAAVFPDFGDLQNNEIRQAIRESFRELDYADQEDLSDLEPPKFRRFFELLLSAAKPNQGILMRLEELDDYGFFAESSEAKRLLNTKVPVIVRLYETQNEALQRAFAAFVLFSIYQDMFIRGTQSRITHAVIFDEAHRASRLKLIPTMAKECRKYGISLVVASQEAKDFPDALFAAIANYLVYRVSEADSRSLAKVIGGDAKELGKALKELPRYHAYFAEEGEEPIFTLLNESF